MIEKTYPSKRIVTVPAPGAPTPGTYYSVYERSQAELRGISVEEYCRRNTVVQVLSTQCGFYNGETVYPVERDEFELYGQCQIVGVCRNMSDLGLDFKWPENDNPMILTFRSSKPTQKNHIFCTTNFLTKKNTHEVTCT